MLGAAGLCIPTSATSVIAEGRTMTCSLIVVDDFHNTLVTLQELFSFNGRDVRAASSGTEAIALMKERPASVVWIDEDLYDFSGSDLAFHLKALVQTHYPHRECITVAVRGDLSPHEMRHIPGFDYAFSKPVDFAKFDAFLAECDQRFSNSKRLAGIPMPPAAG
jgi:DNA-binding NtrC family response regulator